MSWAQYDHGGYLERAEGEVARKRKLVTGMTPQSVESSLHTSRSRCIGTREYWSYAEPSPGLAGLAGETREIEFDRNGRVAWVHSYDMD